MGAWYDSKTKQEVMNLLILKQLQQAVGSFGLTGLDKLLSFMIVKELQVWQLFLLATVLDISFLAQQRMHVCPFRLELSWCILLIWYAFLHLRFFTQDINFDRHTCFLMHCGAAATFNVLMLRAYFAQNKR